jgi:hypothetical protein
MAQIHTFVLSGAVRCVLWKYNKQSSLLISRRRVFRQRFYFCSDPVIENGVDNGQRWAPINSHCFDFGPECNTCTIDALIALQFDRFTPGRIQK